ncbi:MAG: cyclic nucleotide-binding domain-containing protein [Dehalococcoidia bacterium]
MAHVDDHTIVLSQRGYVREVLGRIEAFRQVPPEMLDDIAAEFRGASAQAGEVLVKQGDMGDQLFVVDEGELEVTAERGNRTIRLGKLSRGDVFGEFALVKRSPRTATVTALTPVRLWTLSAEAFNEWMNKSPRLAASVRDVMRRREMANALKALQ